MSFLKYNILKMKKQNIDENFFCEYVRTDQQEKLIKLIKQFNVKVSKLKINWDYMSLYDKLDVEFCLTFKKYINFANLSRNKYLTINHIKEFKDYLDWTNLSKNYKFTVPQLKDFEEYISWQSIFFYQNLPIKTLKEYFASKMWWLFLNDHQETFIDRDYEHTNDLIINKSIQEVPIDFIKQYNSKLEEYTNNQKILKLNFKRELIDYVSVYDKEKQIKKLLPVKIAGSDKNGEEVDLHKLIEKAIEENKKVEDKKSKEKMDKIRKRKNEERARMKEQDKFKDVKYDSDLSTDEFSDSDSSNKSSSESESSDEEEKKRKRRKKRKKAKKKSKKETTDSEDKEEETKPKKKRQFDIRRKPDPINDSDSEKEKSDKE